MRLRNILKKCLVFWKSEPQYAYKLYTIGFFFPIWIFMQTIWCFLFFFWLAFWDHYSDRFRFRIYLAVNISNILLTNILFVYHSENIHIFHWQALVIPMYSDYSFSLLDLTSEDGFGNSDSSDFEPSS